MSRIARRLQMASLPRASVPRSPGRRLETALRSRTARKLRVELRRGSTVALATPRWSQPQTFLEDLALDLAVGEPGVGCRTVSFRAAAGRPLAEAWWVALHVFSQLGQRSWVSGPPMAVVDDRGFRAMLARVLEQAEEAIDHPVALLAHGAEALPVAVLEDIGRVWTAHADALGPDRRCLLLLAGSVPAEVLPGAARVDLLDYGAEEAASALLERGGPFPGRALRTLARFTGGVPGLVDALGERLSEGETPTLNPDALLSALGPMADELRGAVDIASADEGLADRLQALLAGEALPEDPSVDEPLRAAGLIRTSRQGGGPQVELRAPAIAALVA